MFATILLRSLDILQDYIVCFIKVTYALLLWVLSILRSHLIAERNNPCLNDFLWHSACRRWRNIASFCSVVKTLMCWSSMFPFREVAEICREGKSWQFSLNEEFSLSCSHYFSTVQAHTDLVPRQESVGTVAGTSLILALPWKIIWTLTV